MDIKTLQGYISGCISGGTFTLSAAAASRDLSAAIGNAVSLLPGQALVITGATQPASSTQAIVNGQAGLFAGCPAYAVSAVFYLDSTGTPQLTLATTALPTGWTFGQTFTALADSIFDDFPFVNPTFIFASAPGTAAGPYVAGINFLSGLTATGPLTPAQWLVPNLSDLILSGAITLPTPPDEAPTMLLTTPAGNGVNLGVFTVNSAVQLSSDYLGTGEERTLITLAELVFSIPVLSGPPPVTAQVAMGLNASSQDLITFTASTIVIPISNWSDLQTLAPGTDFAALVPAQMPQATSLVISDLNLVVSPRLMQVTDLSVNVGLVGLSWVIIPGAPGQPNVLVLDSASIAFHVPYQTSGSATATISGSFEFSGAVLQLSMALPDLLVTATLTAGQISIGALIAQFVQALTGTVPTLPAMNIFSLDAVADLNANTYTLSAGVQDVWSLTLPSTGFTMEIQSLDVAIDYSNNGLGVGFGGTVLFGTVALAAQVYQSPAGWSFSIGTAPGSVLDLVTVIQSLLSAAFGGEGFWPSFLPQTMGVTNVEFAVEASTDKSGNTASTLYSFQGQTAEPWQFTLGSLAFSIAAAVQVSWQAGGSASGVVSGAITVGNLALTASYAFLPSSETLTAAIDYNGVTLTGTITSGKGQDTIVTIQLGNLSFGEIVDWLVDLVDPSLNFKLSAPWSVLYDISFNNLLLTVNLSKNSVGITYNLNQNLGIIDIGSISLTYVTLAGQGTVMIGFTGQFAGQSFGDQNPLAWDMLNQSPPTPAGQGTQAFDLQYLGLGQQVALVNSDVQTMPAVLAALMSTVKNVQDSQTPPWQQLQFAPSSNLLFGSLFTVMGGITLGIVFNDPQMYGLSVSLSGPKVGSFAGLYFEILYRKVSDSVGVYHIDLKLPTAFRHLEFGEVSFTLPEVIVDIYTNGDFYLDFGFPQNGDWSNSFGVQIFPFVGAGGFYFGKLSATTSSDVPNLPTITNGTWNPVIEFGLALAIGAGKEVSAGPLSGGATVTVQGTLMGVLAWFNPNSASASTATYYWIQGSIAVVGQVYACVDFAIIKVNISVTARASVTLTIAAYQPILIALSASVRVSASVKIVFFTIHFSFGVTLDLSFTIGSASPTPWQVAAGGSSGATATVAQARRRRLRRRPASRQLLAASNQSQVQVVLNFKPVAVLGGITQVPVTLMPTLTVAGTNPQLQVVMTPYLMNAVPPSATTLAATRRLHVAGGATPETTPFSLIIQGLTLWAIQALLGRTTGSISLPDLNNLYYGLSQEDLSQAGLDYSNVDAFFGLNYLLLLTGLPADTPSDTGATSFPMPPVLQMAPQGSAAINFATYTPTDSTYQAKLAAYFGQLQGSSAASQPQDPLQAPAPPRVTGGVADATQSMAATIFTDYALMVMTSAVQNAIDLLQAFPYSTGADDSLASIAAAFSGDATYQVQPGDTLGSIAELFEVPAQKIVDANPQVNFNQPLTLPLSLVIPPATVNATYYTLAGDTLASIATSFAVDPAVITAANPGVDFSSLQPGTALTIPITSLFFGVAGAAASQATAVPVTLAGLTYQVRNGDTLAAIAQRFGLTGSAELATLNQDQSAVLLTGASLAVAGSGGTIPYTVQTGDTYDLVAAYFYVRNLETLPDSNAPWFAQSIVTLNPSVDFSQPLTTGTLLTVPTNQQGSTSTYTTKPGDTLTLVAGYFAAIFNQDAGLLTLAAELQQAYPSGLTPGATIQVPAQSHLLQGQDTLASLAALFGVSVADLAAANAAAPILAVAAVLSLPPVTAAAGQTLSNLAGTYNLTLDDLAGRIGAVPGLLAAGTSLTLPNLTSTEISDLITAMLTQEPSLANNIAGMVSHFMLSGAQFPLPTDPVFQALTVEQIADGEANGKVTLGPLYTLTGQQLALPSVQDPYSITFSNGGGAWLEFATAYTSQPGDTQASISQAYQVSEAALAVANPGVSWTPLAPGTLLTIPVAQSTLTIGLTSAFLQANSPSTTLDPELQSGPERLPLLEVLPVQYGLANMRTWQAGTLPPFAPGSSGGTPPQTGQPSLWQFPTSLLAQVAGAGELHPYALMLGSTADPLATPSPAGYYDWATLLPLTVRQVPAGTGSGSSTTVVEMVGADQDGSQLLQALLTYLTGAGAGDSAQLYLLYSPSSTASNTSGLVSDALDTSATVLLKTNLSTETLGGYQGGANLAELEAPPAGDYYAALGAGTAFIRLLWEASVTGTGGFYLNYATSGGSGLPGNLFASSSTATIWLMAILASESAATNPNRTLYPFLNCAAVLDNLNPAQVNLFAQATDGSNMTEVATVAAGNVGFTLTRANASQEPASAEQLTRALFNLLGYALLPANNPYFSELAEGFPTGPTQPDGQEDDSQWSYQQVVPIYPLATAPLPDLPSALPPAAQNPYRGIAPGAQTTFSFTFSDIFGNTIPSTPAIGNLTIPVGYYDALIGLANWPGCSASYEFCPGSQQPAELTISIDLAAANYVAGGSLSFATAAYNAATDLAKYAQIYYQVQQPDVTFTIQTSFDSPTSPPAADAALKLALANFATAAYLFLNTARSLQAATVTLSQATTLAQFVASVQTTTTDVLNANAAEDAFLIFSSSLTIPTLYVYQSSDTLGSIAAATGVPASQLVALNQAVALNPGAVLSTAARFYTTQSGDTLQSIGNLEATTASDLAVANSQTAGLLNPGTVVTYGQAAVTVGAGDTFDSLVTAFASQGVTVTVAQLGAANASVANLFAPGVQVAMADTPITQGDTSGSRPYTTQSGDTLASIAAAQHCSVAGLATANSQLTGLLTPGTSVTYQGVTQVVAAGDTFVSLVQKFQAQNLTVSVANLAVAVQSLAGLLVAGQAITLTDYVVQAGDSFQSLVSRYSVFSLDWLAALNQQAPTTLYGAGTSLLLGTESYQVLPGDTLTAIAAAYGLTVAQLAPYNGNATLAADATVVLPNAATIPSAGNLYAPYQASGSDALATIAANVGQDLGGLGALNANMPSLINPGQTISASGYPTIVTTASDTFSTLAAQWSVSVAAFVTNPTVAAMTTLLLPGALFVINLPTVTGSPTLQQLAANLNVTLDDLALANGPTLGLLHPGTSVIPYTGATVSLTVGSSDTLQTLVTRFASECGITTTVTQIAAANATVAGLPQGAAPFLVPPQAVQIIRPVADPFIPAPIFPLAVSITMSRSTSLIDPDFQGVSAVTSNTSALGANASVSLTALATSFEQAFLAQSLKLATGPNPDDSAGQPLWVVNLGAGGISQVALAGNSPLFFGIQPLSTQLISLDNVPIEPLEKDGTLGPAVAQSFQSVDPELWVRELLSAIDLFLSPGYAVPAYQISSDNYSAVVAAKGQIAEAILPQVAPILQPGAPLPAGALSAAQEALNQSLLVSLSQGYATDALVQFQTSVHSPFSAPFTTGAADGFAQPAAYYGVSQPAFAGAAATLPAILNVGQIVSYQGQPYTLQASDTLQTVADHYQVSVTALPGNLTVTSGGGLFAPGVVITLSAMTKAVLPADSFASLAVYFGTTPGAVGTANENVQGIIPAGTVIRIGSTQYTVAAGDTLTTIAAAFGLTPAAFAADPAICTTVGLLTSPQTLGSFSDQNQVAPRLVGNGSSQVYQVPAGLTMAGLNTAFPVSLAFLTDIVDGMNDILNVGATFTFAGKPYQIQPGDTLLSIANTLGTNPLTLVQQMVLPPGVGLFAPGAGISLLLLAKQPASSDCFALLAEYFAVSVAQVAEANATQPGIILAGTTITLSTGGSYVVQAGDTLTTIAAALQVSVEALASDPDVVLQTGIFATTNTLYMVLYVPPTTFSTAKTALAAGESPVTFLFNTTADTSYRNLLLSMNYPLNALEFAVQNVPGVTGYQASNWLTFILPLPATSAAYGVDTRIGLLDIPIPLRFYPPLPTLTAQTWEETHPEASTIAAAKQWSFDLSWQHQDAAQDTATITVLYNQLPPLTDLRAGNPALYEALAQFYAVWAPLQALLAGLLDLSGPPPTSGPLVNAVQSFAQVVTQVAQAWSEGTPRGTRAGQGLAEITYTYLVETTYEYTPTATYRSQLLLAADPSGAPFPTIYLPPSQTPLPAQPQPDGSMVYIYPPETPAFTALVHRFVYPGNDAIAIQNGQAQISIARNEILVNGAATNPAFIYQTPTVTYPNLTVPFVQNNNAIIVGSGENLTAALTQMFEQILNASDPLTQTYQLQLAFRYGHPLVPGDPPIISYMPGFLAPLVTLNATAGIGALVAAIEAQINTWVSQYQPRNAAPDVYAFTVTVFASNWGTQPPPLLQLGQLIYCLPPA